MLTLTNQIGGMPAAFGGRFGLINASLKTVANELCSWRRAIGFGPKRVDLPEGLAISARLLLPLARLPVNRDLAVATRNPAWTANFDAYPNGGDPFGPTRVLGRRLHVQVATITAIPFQGEPGAIPNCLGGLVFTYSPDGSIGSARSIALVEGESSSSRYYFEDGGPVQPWEEPEHYTARRKRDRLTPEMIERYCRALGIDDVFNPDYYSGPSVFIDRTWFR
jgi:hypothetical protein